MINALELLIDAGADVNAPGEEGCVFGGRSTALMKAAAKGHDKCVKLLIEAGADVKIPNLEDGSTALMHAALGSFEKCVTFLIEAGS